ncbi:MAG TPA: hypothetical protein VK879_02820 [Candidatus Sulfomarinibacteraceae bacterium]|nr:hypothetical protein [Candidatus Sulfomarinibacteraceae bacterium]
MKALLAVAALVLVLIAAWISLGWLALLVLPVGSLALLMTITPALVAWEKEQPATASQKPSEDPAVARPASACA